MSKNLGNLIDPTQSKLAQIERERQFQGIFDLPTAHIPETPVPSASQRFSASRRNISSSFERDPHFQDQVRHYTNWLHKQAQYDRQRDRVGEIMSYRQEATRVETVGKLKVASFAPFRARFSALQTFTWGQFFVLSILGLLWLAGLYELQLLMLTATIAAITCIYTISLLINLILVLRSARASTDEQIKDELVYALQNAEWPMYTILCPLYKEAQVVPQFVKAMQALDYPTDKLQILFLTEENDDETRVAIRDMDLPSHFRIIVTPDGQPRTKPRACNYGLLYTEGSYVVIYDAEDQPDPLQLKKAILTFANHGTNVACVQAKLNFYNSRQNILTRWFTAEYSAWFDVVLPALQTAHFALPLGGTSNHFRVDLLRALGAWDAYNVTEDCDLGLRLKRYKLETVILDSTTLEEANPQLKNWIRQRSRWIKGYMQTYLVHMRHPLEYLRKGRFYELFSFQMVVGSGTGVLLLNPLMWILTGIYIYYGTQVVNLYHLLFPGPVLYLGAFCLICGNFFYLYLYLLACMKKKLYHLAPWVVFIPIYWLLMSVAAFFALYELMVKPHYWQKTVHGLHMKKKQIQQKGKPQTTVRAGLAHEHTMLMPVIPSGTSKTNSVSSITMSLKAMPTQMMPAISPQQKKAQKVVQRAKVRDLWLVATMFIACVTSVVACYYFFQQHAISLYADSLSHLRISRAVFDNLTPGLAQLGGIWLPLPHIIMWPFIWNDYLWRTGLAGSFADMPCYIVATFYIFRSARKLTRNSCAAFIGTLVFIFNPNVLYLQATPLTEVVCMATLAMSCYYFLCWIEDGTTKSLAITAACTFLATLARYDGWPLFVAILVFIPVVGIMKHRRFSQIISNIIVFCLLGGLGIVLWLVWNKLIFGDPLYFQRSAFYSSQSQQQAQHAVNHLFSYHNVWQAIRFYTLDVFQNVGVILCVLAALALLLFILSRRFKPETLGGLLFWVPFAFYCLSLYTGQAIIWLPQALPVGLHLTLYNVRYGAQMTAPVAVFVAILAAHLRLPSHARLQAMSRVLLVGVIILQCCLTFSQGIITLKEGQYYYSCFAPLPIAKYLSQHYQGGRVLEDLFANQVDPVFLGLDFKDIIYEGNGQVWTQALEYPESTVDWVIVTPTNPQDLVAQYLNVHSQAFLSDFTLVARGAKGMELYHRKGQSLLPLHPGLTIWNVPHDACN